MPGPSAAPAILRAPGDALGMITALLPLADRLSLAATCTALRQASQSWFPEEDVRLEAEDAAAVASLAAWLRRHSSCQAHLFLSGIPDIGSAAEGGASRVLRALRGTQVASIIARNSGFTPGTLTPAAALEGFGSLTSLDFTWECLEGDLRHVCLLTRLCRLVLDCTHMTGSWCQLAALTRLQHLDVDAAELNAQEVAEALSALVALTHLELGCVEGASSWRHLAGLEQLRRLVLAGDDLQQVPEHLLALPRLEYLHLLSDFTAIPHRVSALTSLTCLSLSGNYELSAGWQHLAPLTRLRRLDLTSCMVVMVPPELERLTRLTALVLNHACVEGGWQHLRPLQQLQELDISRAGPEAGMEAMPDALTALTALTSLRMGSIFRLSDFRHLAAMAQLRQLSLHWSYLSGVPYPLSALTTLTSLDLSHNKIQDWWEHLEPLGHLQSLDLQGCELTQLPSVLSSLTALTSLLQEGSNPLTGGW